jgi:hypothetical protein
MGILMVKYRCLTNSIIIFLSEIRTGSRKLAFCVFILENGKGSQLRNFRETHDYSVVINVQKGKTGKPIAA